jgi:hypothetical protein
MRGACEYRARRWQPRAELRLFSAHETPFWRDLEIEVQSLGAFLDTKTMLE